MFVPFRFRRKTLSKFKENENVKVRTPDANLTIWVRNWIGGILMSSLGFLLPQGNTNKNEEK
jgi:hypothetical protein